MSNTKHTPPASVPPMTSLPPGRAARRREATGQDVPPSPDVAQARLAGLIGQTVAAHLGHLLQQMPWQPECAACVVGAKRTVRGYEVAVANAQAAGEPLPDMPEQPAVAGAVTWIDGSPVCWEHVPLVPKA